MATKSVAKKVASKSASRTVARVAPARGRKVKPRSTPWTVDEVVSRLPASFTTAQMESQFSITRTSAAALLANMTRRGLVSRDLKRVWSLV